MSYDEVVQSPIFGVVRRSRQPTRLYLRSLSVPDGSSNKTTVRIGNAKKNVERNVVLSRLSAPGTPRVLPVQCRSLSRNNKSLTS